MKSLTRIVGVMGISALLSGCPLYNGPSPKSEGPVRTNTSIMDRADNSYALDPIVECGLRGGVEEIIPEDNPYKIVCGNGDFFRRDSLEESFWYEATS